MFHRVPVGFRVYKEHSRGFIEFHGRFSGVSRKFKDVTWSFSKFKGIQEHHKEFQGVSEAFQRISVYRGVSRGFKDVPCGFRTLTVCFLKFQKYSISFHVIPRAIQEVYPLYLLKPSSALKPL